MEQQRRRNVVREISENLDRSPPPQRPHVEIQCVARNDAQPLLTRKTHAQEIRQPPVFFQHGQPRAGFERRAGQSTQAGTDLDEFVARLHVELGDDPAGKVLVVEKILAERFRRREL